MYDYIQYVKNYKTQVVIPLNLCLTKTFLCKATSTLKHFHYKKNSSIIGEIFSTHHQNIHLRKYSQETDFALNHFI